jgi:hypothetical protein
MFTKNFTLIKYDIIDFDPCNSHKVRSYKVILPKRTIPSPYRSYHHLSSFFSEISDYQYFISSRMGLLVLAAQSLIISALII